jgi:hypothetical protein
MPLCSPFLFIHRALSAQCEKNDARKMVSTLTGRAEGIAACGRFRDGPRQKILEQDALHTDNERSILAASPSDYWQNA